MATLANVRRRHVRLDFSPARESLRGIRVLLHPAGHAEQLPWLRRARRALTAPLRREIESFGFFFEPHGETFPSLWNEPGVREFGAEIAALSARPDAYCEAVVRRLSGEPFIGAADIARMSKPQWYRRAARACGARHPSAKAMLNGFVDSPAESLRQFCRMLDAFHAIAIAPSWKSIEPLLRADIDMRKRVARDFGITALMRTLTSEITVRGSKDAACVRLTPDERRVTFDEDSELLLTPSFFCWPNFEAFVRRTPHGLRCTIAYPVPPLTARAPAVADAALLVAACDALGDRVRLRILELLNVRELSTRELAAFLKQSEPAVSRHLRMLLEAGVVSQRRSGYFVMYAVDRPAIRRLTAALAAFQ
jgi:DNA-binding transcriptional ArsR family regulator